jgi:hypothetical protein
LAEVVSNSQSFEESMAKMLDWGETVIPHQSWKALKALDLSNDVSRVAPWIRQVTDLSPAPFPVKGIYFGLGEFADSAGVEYADLYFGLMGQCDLSDKACGWLWDDPRHYPDGAYLESTSLRAAGRVCYEDEENGLSTPGQEIFCLSFAALLLRHGLSSQIYAYFNTNSPIAVVTGFDSGDLIRLGLLEANGFTTFQGQFICE